MSRPHSTDLVGKNWSGYLLTPEAGKKSSHHRCVSKVEQMETALRKLSQTGLRQIRESLDDLVEHEMEFTPVFERSIQECQRDLGYRKGSADALDRNSRHTLVATPTR